MHLPSAKVNAKFSTWFIFSGSNDQRKLSLLRSVNGLFLRYLIVAATPTRSVFFLTQDGTESPITCALKYLVVTLVA